MSPRAWPLGVLASVLALTRLGAASQLAPPAGVAEQPLKVALAAARSGGGPWPTLHVATECLEGGAARSAEIHGNGVAIWNGRRQFTLDPAGIRAVLAAFDAAAFAELRDVYGGRSVREPGPVRVPDGNPAAEVTCRVSLELDGLRKEVAQLSVGEQSAALRRLAGAILAACEEPARAGIEAADLADGLAKVAAGRLAPEVLRVTFQRRPERASVGRAGLVLEVNRARATSRRPGADGGQERAVSVALPPAELASLAGSLAQADPASFPTNLWAGDYTDLTVAVLGHGRTVQARRFTGMSAATHGARQRAFDDVCERLLALERRVRREGP
jgi:hypothetical protein